MLALAFVLAALLVVAVILVKTSRSGIVPWLDQMSRVNPGVPNRAEWMAPPDVQEAVKRDYLSFYSYAARTLPGGWNAYLRDLHRYLDGTLLQEQRTSLESRLHRSRGRIIDILRAHHRLTVRHFSDDGLTCLLIDHQSERRLATYDYWTHRRIHTQDIGDLILIYEMRYDTTQERWKLTRLIQSLPPGICHPATLEIDLPQAVGRDC